MNTKIKHFVHRPKPDVSLPYMAMHLRLSSGPAEFGVWLSADAARAIAADMVAAADAWDAAVVPEVAAEEIAA